MDKLLPIGSIIKLGQTDYDIVICGYGGAGENGKAYDYIGVIYPYGFISKDKILSFNKDKVTKVVFEGYKSQKYDDVITQMMDDIETYRKKGANK
jgi:hypothetical protein